MSLFQKTKFIRPTFLDRPNYKSIGYVLTSNIKSSDTDQVAALQQAGCCVVFLEHAHQRPIEFKKTQLYSALKTLSPEDELVITQLSRLGNKQLEIFSRIDELQEQRKYVRTLDGKINTRKIGPLSPLLMGLISGIAEVAIEGNRERKYEPIHIHQGNKEKIRGRPKTNPAKESLVLRLRNEGYSYRSIKEQTGLALSTIRRIIVEEKKQTYECSLLDRSLQTLKD